MLDFAKMFSLTGRTAIVTGGAGLLGLGFSKTLAKAGAAVVVADIQEESANQVADSLSKRGYPVIGHPLDVTSQYSINHMVDAVITRFKRIDILVNSAALDPKFDPKEQGTHSDSFEEFPLSMWQQALNVNLTGTMLCCQAVSKHMLSAGSGVIINIASIYGIVGPDQSIYRENGKPIQYKPAYYSVTKAGILGLTKYLATYFAGKNIRVNALTPGGVYNDHDEGFLSRYASRVVLGRMADKDELNGALLFLASDASSYMTGSNLVVDGGWTAW